jgi:3-phosphoshikimate 1-carboxyvinyltransferase
MKLEGKIILPGDKSISHRAIMLSSIANGRARITNLLKSEDTLATLAIFKQLGVEIEELEEEVIITGKGLDGLLETDEILDCQNSGTTARLLLGLFSGLPFKHDLTLTGDTSLSKRPMKRAVKPLQALGSHIDLTEGNYLPATINPSTLKSNRIELEVASAQVKSSVLLAALKCKEQSVIIEKQRTRNHTELMLSYMGCDLKVNGLEITISGKKPLIARDILVPGDISSAAFFMVAALVVPNSQITLVNCGINPTRIGILTILDQIGANYQLNNQHLFGNEAVCDLEISYTKDLKPFTITEEIVPELVDEIPILALLATQIEGDSIITGAGELRVKETDRIHAVVSELTKLGAHLEEREDGMVIKGKCELKANDTLSYHDHRISMMLKVARLMTGSFKIEGEECDHISYPQFEQDLNSLIK